MHKFEIVMCNDPCGILVHPITLKYVQFPETDGENGNCKVLKKYCIMQDH